MNIKYLLLGGVLFLLGHLGVFHQLNGQFKWEWFKNNPHIDYRFNPGDFDIIYTDHDRAYTDDINVPLVEQILLRFGLTLEDLSKIDSRPSLYFDKDENPNPDIKDDYGCLLFASRIDKLKGRWDDKNLIKEARKYKDTPVYYHSEIVTGKQP